MKPPLHAIFHEFNEHTFIHVVVADEDLTSQLRSNWEQQLHFSIDGRMVNIE